MIDPQSFVGRSETRRDWADRDRMARLAATLDHPAPLRPATVLPPLGHWLCFLPSERQSMIGPDGHPLRTGEGLLPNVDLPRRMWAGSRIRFLGDIALDAAITRRSTLIAAVPKSGRSGDMLFVTVQHEIAAEGCAPALIEEQDLVYRQAARAGQPFSRSAADPGDPDPVVRVVTPDPVLLFRYSALTFNSHRIHYDQDYARNAEGYPGLVVHGPLIATLMLDHVLRHEQGRVREFSFRAAAPSFDGEPIQFGYRHDRQQVHLRAINPAGVAMVGAAVLEP